MLKDIVGYMVIVAAIVGVYNLFRGKRPFCPYCSLDLNDCECDREAIEAARKRDLWWAEEERKLGLR